MIDVSTLKHSDTYSRVGREILDYPSKYGTEIGKFVRIGSIVIAAPQNENCHALRTNHEWLLKYALAGPDAALTEAVNAEVEVAKQQSRPTLHDRTTPTVLEDVGYFRVSPASSLDREFLAGNPQIGSRAYVVVNGRSQQYGEADHAGRDLTGKQFQIALGGFAFVDAL